MVTMPRKNDAFVSWVGSKWNQLKDWRSGRSTKNAPALPKDDLGRPVPLQSLTERLEARFEDMMQEVDELSNQPYSLEEHAEYGWIVLVRVFLPMIFFLGFGY